MNNNPKLLAHKPPPTPNTESRSIIGLSPPPGAQTRQSIPTQRTPSINQSASVALSNRFIKSTTPNGQSMVPYTPSGQMRGQQLVSLGPPGRGLMSPGLATPGLGLATPGMGLMTPGTPGGFLIGIAENEYEIEDQESKLYTKQFTRADSGTLGAKGTTHISDHVRRQQDDIIPDLIVLAQNESELTNDQLKERSEFLQKEFDELVALQADLIVPTLLNQLAVTYRLPLPVVDENSMKAEDNNQIKGHQQPYRSLDNNQGNSSAHCDIFSFKPDQINKAIAELRHMKQIINGSQNGSKLPTLSNYVSKPEIDVGTDKVLTDNNLDQTVAELTSVYFPPFELNHRELDTMKQTLRAEYQKLGLAP